MFARKTLSCNSFPAVRPMENSFLFGIAAAAGSAFSLGLVLIFDRVMVSDCYRGSSRQAWLVSSVLGAVFGLIATAIIWVLASTQPETGMARLVSAFHDLLWPQGVLMLVAGAMTIQTMEHYFSLFKSSEAEAPNETLIALWLSSSPIFIFLAFFMVSSAGFEALQGSGIEKSNFTLPFAFSIVLAVFFIAAAEYADAPKGQTSTVRYSEIIKMLSCIVGYTLIISGILRADEIDQIHSIALQPYYWIGYLAGARVLLTRKDRLEFKRNWPRLKIFWRLIVAVEILGMLVYFLEYYGLGNIDAALVNLILGGQVVVVFLLSLLLSRTRSRFEAEGIRRKWFLGLRLVTHRLPKIEPKTASIARLAAAQAAILLAVYTGSL